MVPSEEDAKYFISALSYSGGLAGTMATVDTMYRNYKWLKDNTATTKQLYAQANYDMIRKHAEECKSKNISTFISKKFEEGVIPKTMEEFDDGMFKDNEANDPQKKAWDKLMSKRLPALNILSISKADSILLDNEYQAKAVTMA